MNSGHPKWTKYDGALGLLEESGGPFEKVSYRRALTTCYPLTDMSFGAQLSDGTLAALAITKKSKFGVAISRGYAAVRSTRPLSANESSSFLEAARVAGAMFSLQLFSIAPDCSTDSRPSVHIITFEDRAIAPTSNYSSVTRQNVRKATKAGVQVALVPEAEPFLRLFAAESASYETGDSTDFVARVIANGDARVYEGRLAEEVVTACVVLTAKDYWTYWLSAQNENGRATNAAWLVLDQVIRDAFDSSTGWLNLGSSDYSNGAVYFKERFGAKRVAQSEQLVAPPAGKLLYRGAKMISSNSVFRRLQKQ